MNAFNRLIVVLLILAILLTVALIVIVPQRAFDFSSAFFAWLSANVQAFDRQNWAVFATARVLIGLVIGLAGLILLWLEFRRPRKKIIRAQKLEGGESFIAVEAITQRLAYNIDQLPDVVKVTPQVLRYGRGGLDLELVLETAPEIDVPMKTEEVLQRTREVVTERMGLTLGKVRVKIKHAPYPKQ